MKTVWTIVTLLICQVAWAHNQSESAEIRVLKEVKTVKGQKAFVVAKMGGHLVGQPFQVELRVGDDPHTAVVHDSFSVCDMDPDSIKLNRAKSAVAMKVKEVDLDNYDSQVERGIASPQAKCQKQSTIKKFSLKWKL